MNGECRYLLDWHAGSSAEVDLRAARDGGTYLLRYASPFRPTMRAPSQEIPAGADDLEQINIGLNEFAERVVGVSRGGGDGVAAAPSDVDLQEFGQQLFEMVLPRHVQSDLSKSELFVEIGTDDKLLHYPWELMHDGEEFLCLKHYLGRFVNLDRTLELNGATPFGPGFDLGELRVLVISVPQPRPRGGQAFARLAAAESEAQAIIETLAAGGLQPEILHERDATTTNVARALRRPWHIIHFAGHAVFDAENPRQTALVLDNANITVGGLTARLQNQRAVLCVVNACESTRGSFRATRDDTVDDEQQRDDGDAEEAVSWTDQYDIYGLARAFLETGAYLLGSRWNLNDKSAERFARAFYSGLVLDGQPIGRAITDARTKVKEEAEPEDLSWASYVYYGDPRVCVKRELVESSAAAAPAAPQSQARVLVEAHPSTDPRAGVVGAVTATVEPVPPPAAAAAEAPEEEPEAGRGPLDQIAREYEATRRGMRSSHERTRKLSELFDQARLLAVAHDYSALVPTLFEDGDGDRIVALAVIQVHPDARHFDQVHEAIGQSRSAFEQYHGLAAARLLCDQLSADQETALAATLRRLMEDTTFFGTDRFLLASDILSRLGHTTARGNPDFE